MRLDNNVGSMTYDNLIIRAGDVGSIKLSAGQGTLKRGSLVTEEQTMAATDTTDAIDGSILATGGKADASYVLTDDFDTTDGAVVATVYKNGKFVKDSLIISGTADDKDFQALRQRGIIVEDGVHFPSED